jgi:hypothetical protein
MSSSTAVLAASASGDNVVVAAVPGLAIRVLYAVVSFSNGPVNGQFRSDTGGGALNLTGLLYGPGAAGSSQTLDIGSVSPVGRGLFQTALGKALNLWLSGALAVGGFVVYELVSQ